MKVGEGLGLKIIGSKVLLFFLSAFLILSMAGCRLQEKTSEGTGKSVQEPSNVAVAKQVNTGVAIPSNGRLAGKVLYFTRVERDENTEASQVMIYAVQEEEAKLIASVSGENYLTYFVNGEGTVYLVYKASNGQEIHLKALSAAGETIYDENLSELLVDDADNIELLSDIADGVSAGGIVYMVCANGQLYEYDRETGTLFWRRLSETGISWDEELFYGGRCGLVDTGKTGVFKYFIQDDRITLQALSDEKKIVEIAFDKEMTSGILRVELYGGCDGGVFICCGEGLWKFDLSSRQLDKLFGWEDEYMNLGGRTIDSVGYVQSEGFTVLTHNYMGQDPMLANIAYKDMLDMEEKQKITIGISAINLKGNPMTYNMIKSRFNGANERYYVEYVAYDSFWDIQMALVKGEAADIMLVEGTQVDLLARIGVFEDLTPYFEESSVVSEEDLLPCIREALTKDGKIIGATDSFQVDVLWIKKGAVRENWDVAEFLTFLEENKESVIMNSSQDNYKFDVLYGYLYNGIFDKFVDFDNGKCSFDSDEFVELLERLNRLDMAQVSLPSSADSDYKEARIQAFMDGTLLSIGSVINSPDIWNDYLDDYADYAECVGYPHEGDEPYYSLDFPYLFAMNSASPNKEGAWAFLENLLDENYQNSSEGILPVRIDSFEKAVERTTTNGGRNELDMTGEERKLLRHIIQNAHWSGNVEYEVTSIIYEETAYLFSGSKSAREVAELIQDRVQIYLDERE